MLIATITISGQTSNLIYDNQQLYFDGYLEIVNDVTSMKKLIKALGITIGVLPVQVDVVESLSKYKNVDVRYENVIPEFADQTQVFI
jgi:hypothetical protein